MAKGIMNSVIGLLPLIIIVVVLLVFSTRIQDFVKDITKTKEEKEFELRQKTEEQRKDEQGLFDNIAEFFFGKPTEDEPATDDGVSKNDFDQNSATQQQRASKAQTFSDQQLVEDIAEQNSQTNSGGGGFEGSSVGVSDTITATVIRNSTSKGSTRPKGKTITVNLGSKSGSRITATPEGLVTTRSGGGSSSSRASRGGGSSGSRATVSDRITATVIRGSSSSSSARPKGNLSKQSQSLNTKTRGSSRFNR